MLTLSYLDLLLLTLGQAVVYLGLGVALAHWWAKPQPEPWNRPSREWEADRFGSAMDGTLSRIRWLPGLRGEDEEGA